MDGNQLSPPALRIFPLFGSGYAGLGKELGGKGQSKIEHGSRMHAILSDVLNGSREPDYHDFFDTGAEVPLDLMVHFGFPVARRKDFDDELGRLKDGVSRELVPSYLGHPDHVGHTNSSGGGEDGDFLDGFFPELLAQLTDQA